MPLTRYAVMLGLALGLLIGLGGFTFIYAKGASYLTNDPNACVNCHVMQEQFDGWVTGSHRRVAVCNDCHAPHDLIGKYVTKARNGFWHSFYFTFGGYPDPIRITPHNAEITEHACRSCHAAVVMAIDTHPRGNRTLDCVPCHRNVGHLH